MPDLGMCGQNQHQQTSSPAKQSPQNYSKLPAILRENTSTKMQTFNLNERIRTLAETFTAKSALIQMHQSPLKPTQLLQDP
ncbi:hypothetical protein TNCV_3082521 [Trichonephila clavipes]|nr:hypothetical protein TNCV_3082521 [Trichonephila clavipes]